MTLWPRTSAWARVFIAAWVAEGCRTVVLNATDPVLLRDAHAAMRLNERRVDRLMTLLLDEADEWHLRQAWRPPTRKRFRQNARRG